MVWIKICGVTTPTDAAFAAGCGADAVGLNFYPKSKRFVTDEQADAVARELPPSTAAVGVFVDDPVGAITRRASRLRLRAMQTYSYPLDPIDPLPEPGPAWVLAFRVEDELNLSGIEDMFEEAMFPWGSKRPDAVLIDSFVPGEMGGTGRTAPWELIAKCDFGVPVILAGGLTPDNLAEAIRTVRPAGVDVASGVESAPGKKDPGKVRAFIQAAREAAAALPPPDRAFRLSGGSGLLE
jgi:phosphoribosylanthranilate isomerase